MKTVEIYTSPFCGYCHAAKRLLTSKSVAFTEIDVMADPAQRAEMTRRSNGGRTVPQIFIDGQPIGGSDDLHALDRAGRLDALLKD
ncbi:glutaredoxin 3 [Szabonella alba]|uniref:Glutaredoxin n=1 Tax=Szabonella alba TaxID=2804194 RepID=A0A8K0VCZ5_9RHOB|nr:glutaredoxin 3 [Szabonella alba]MBL4916870.1 glutaredoxin 3 [Szabonella alba]